MTELTESGEEMMVESLFNRTESSVSEINTLVLDDILEKEIETFSISGNTATMQFAEPIEMKGDVRDEMKDEWFDGDDRVIIKLSELEFSVY